jgi:hypothetical protein
VYNPLRKRNGHDALLGVIVEGDVRGALVAEPVILPMTETLPAWAIGGTTRLALGDELGFYLEELTFAQVEKLVRTDGIGALIKHEDNSLQIRKEKRITFRIIGFVASKSPKLQLEEKGECRDRRHGVWSAGRTLPKA